MLSQADRDELRDYARGLIAQEVERLRPVAGEGVTLKGNLVMTGPPGARPEEDVVEVLMQRRVSSGLLLEETAAGVRVNCPPVYGAMPTLDGMLVLAEPRPTLALPEVVTGVYVRVSYTRSNVTLTSDLGGSSKTAGLTLGTVTAEVITSETTPVDTVPGSGSDIPPHAGAYVLHVALGTMGPDGVVSTANLGALLGDGVGWGGTHMQMSGVFSTGPGWEFVGALTT